MISRGSEMVFSSIYFLFAVIFIAVSLGEAITSSSVSETVIIFGGLSVSFAILGTWSVHRALKGKKEDKKTMADLDSKISSLTNDRTENDTTR